MFKPRPWLLSLAISAALGLVACSDSTAPSSAGSSPDTTAAAAPVVQRPQKQYPIEDFLDTVAVGGASFSADASKVLFSSSKSGVWNAYTMPAEGGDWTAVTQSSTDNVYAVGFFPNDDRILVTRDQGGNELNHLFLIDATGKETDLTPGEKLKAQFIDFSTAGDAFYVSSNERDPRYFDVYRYDAETLKRELIFTNDKGYEPALVSGDGRFVALTQTNSTNDNSLYLYELASKKHTLLSEHEGDALFSAEDFSPDGKYLYYTSNAGSEFARLRRYELASGAHEDVQAESWDIAFSYFSPKGKYRVTGVNADGATSIRLYDAATGAEVALPKLPAGELRGATFSNDEQKLALYLNGDRQPSDLYVFNLGEPGEPKRLTNTLSSKIDPEDLVETSVVRYQARDGLEIPNILWKPHQASAENKAPAILLIHGGPGGQTTRAWNYLAQYLANHGYVVLGVNNRGSSGYGKTFFAADDGKHGREPLWDCVDAKSYLQTLDYVDPNKIGIMGGSYGGYMTLAALAFQPDEFKVGVDIFGVSNWLRTLESIPPYWESFRKALYQEIGDPATQRDFLIETSPLFHADKIKKPLLVLQGANDPRVIKPESDEIVAAVKKNGVPVEYLVFDDEGHGFTKKENQIASSAAILKFLDTYLKADAPPAAPAAETATSEAPTKP